MRFILNSSCLLDWEKKLGKTLIQQIKTYSIFSDCIRDLLHGLCKSVFIWENLTRYACSFHFDCCHILSHPHKNSKPFICMRWHRHSIKRVKPNAHTVCICDLYLNYLRCSDAIARVIAEHEKNKQNQQHPNENSFQYIFYVWKKSVKKNHVHDCT